MSHRINIKQLMVLVFGGSLSLFFIGLALLSPDPGLIAIFLVMSVPFFYWTARMFWIAADPRGGGVLLKPQAESSLIRGICPFCKTNPYSDETLKVGYRKPRITRFEYWIVLIRMSFAMDELITRLPICTKCKETYLALLPFRIFARLGLDRSFKVLDRKLGYFRGIQFPFEHWNIKHTSES